MFVKLFLIAFPVFLLIDMLWLGVVAKSLYRKEMVDVIKTDFNWIAAFSFYLIFIGGLVTFVLAPAVEKGSWTHALVYGALFGFVTYATYDLTNLAVTKDWPLFISLVDMVWGAVLAASVSVITYYIISLWITI